MYASCMNTRYPLASTAALIADPARAAMLTALLHGGSLPAGELARIAGVSPQSASMHLAQLVDGGLLRVAPQGRHRYYSIARPEVAHAVEALGVISTIEKYRPSGADRALCYARTCYDHLAGELSVQLAGALQRKGFLVREGDRDFDLTRDGEAFLQEWKIDPAELRGQRRSFARCCRDWTEREDHVGGALGAAICTRMLESRWITRDRYSRAVHVSLDGRKQLSKFLDLRIA
jgi:DNA-binding transcriptional ArsR family regulator